MPCFGCPMKNSSTEHLLYPFGFGFPGWFKHTLVSGYAWSLLLMFQSSQRKIHSIIKRFTSMSTMMWPSIQDHTWKSAMSRQRYQTEKYSKHRQMCLIIRVDHSHLLLLVSFQSQILSWIELATEWVELKGSKYLAWKTPQRKWWNGFLYFGLNP